MHRLLRLAPVLALLVIGGFLAACGGSDLSSDPGKVLASAKLPAAGPAKSNLELQFTPSSSGGSSSSGALGALAGSGVTITATAQGDAASGLTAPIVGHVGDGNFHTVILVPDEPDGMARAWALDKAIVARALSLGGSCSGEHGVGIGKREFLEIEHGAETLAVMRSVKVALDPKGILNPGKIFLN